MTGGRDTGRSGLASMTGGCDTGRSGLASVVAARESAKSAAAGMASTARLARAAASVDIPAQARASLAASCACGATSGTDAVFCSSRVTISLSERAPSAVPVRATKLAAAGWVDAAVASRPAVPPSSVPGGACPAGSIGPVCGSVAGCFAVRFPPPGGAGGGGVSSFRTRKKVLTFWQSDRCIVAYADIARHFIGDSVPGIMPLLASVNASWPASEQRSFSTKAWPYSMRL